MNFTSRQFDFGETVIHLLEYSEFDPLEYLGHLTEDETARFWTFRHLKRQREFIATRILRHDIFGFRHIHYNAVGAPYIEGEGFISISHALNIVGIALNRKFQTGLDLELIQDKAWRLRSKFLSEAETDALDTSDHIEMTKCWSAKETLYKLAGRKQIDFRADLHLKKQGALDWQGKIINPGETISVDLHIFEYKDYVISFNSSPIAASEN